MQRVEERRQGFNEAIQAAGEAEERLRRRLQPLCEAVHAMAVELSLNPMFAAAMGKPQIVITRVGDDDDDRGGDLRLIGLAGTLSFNVYGHSVFGTCQVSTKIEPSPSVIASLRCDRSYGDGASSCDLMKVSELIDRARNHLVDLLADIYLCSSSYGR